MTSIMLHPLFIISWMLFHK